MRCRHNFAPGVEGLEGKRLLSGLAAGTASITALNGAFRGRFHEPKTPVDAGDTFRLSGQGRAAPGGGLAVSGRVQALGFIASGHASGALRLRSPGGTVTLTLTGPEQGGFAQLPARFAFEVTGGTGRFAHVTGSGTAVLVRYGPSHEVIGDSGVIGRPPPIPSGFPLPHHGTFTLSLISAGIKS